MTMEPGESLEDRVELLLRCIAKGAEQRDLILQDVTRYISDRNTLSASVDEVCGVSRRMLLPFVDNSAGLARTIAVSASLAERSSWHVKRLDVLLRRVGEAKVIADSLKEMRHTVGSMTATIQSGDLDSAVQLIRKYEAASVHLGGCTPKSLLQDSQGAYHDHDASWTGASAANEGGDGVQQQQEEEGEERESRQKNGDMVLAHSGGKRGGNDMSRDEPSSIIASAREITREKLLAKFCDATRGNDKLTIMHTTSLLMLLGFRDESCDLYCKWMCDHTITALSKMVERELRKMDDPNEAGMSHLALVSNALDVVVATFENEEEFMRETFGNAGLLQLLTELHSRSASQCVPVLEDFLKKRQEVLQSVSAPAATAGSSRPTTGASVSTSLLASSATVAAGAVLDPRRTDQILEEMSHLVSCCHLYWTFAQSKQQEYTHSVEGDADKGNREVTVVSADSLWSSLDNPLMNIVQEILAAFVPLQKRYFEVAFDHAFQLQMEVLHANYKEASSPRGRRGAEEIRNGGGSGKKGVTVSSPSAKSATAFMTGLAALYSSTTAGSGMHEGQGWQQSDAMYDRHVPITFPDDVFFFFRIALHRAMNTKSTQIISAVFIACGELLHSRMMPLLDQYTALPPGVQLQQQQQEQEYSGRRTVPLRLLRWTNAAQCTATYAHKLADELRRLALANFSARDLLRFTEQAEDMEALSREFAAMVEKRLKQFSEILYQTHIEPHLERFALLPYELSEDMFYHYELSDPWVQACVAATDMALQPFVDCLDTQSFDTLLLALVQFVTRAVWQALVQKTFSGYGALQVDRDVRTLRAFFLNRSHEVQLWDRFLTLSSATSLLLLDNPKDAEHDVYEGLSADEKRRVLGCRVEFSRAEIERLRL